MLAAQAAIKRASFVDGSEKGRRLNRYLRTAPLIESGSSPPDRCAKFSMLCAMFDQIGRIAPAYPISRQAPQTHGAKAFGPFPMLFTIKERCPVMVGFSLIVTHALKSEN